MSINVIQPAAKCRNENCCCYFFTSCCLCQGFDILLQKVCKEDRDVRDVSQLSSG